MPESYSAPDLVMLFLKEQMPHSPDYPEIYKLVLGASHDIINPTPVLNIYY